MAVIKDGKSIGKVAKGLVIEGQGTVPYNGPKSVDTPSTSTVMVSKGKKKGMGAAIRDGSYTYC
jgi:hypothetical protein|tara:strand:+ start:3026 stop:3217 length:192 start_codon:yes stop_codon:yes gene_type:complete